MQDKAEVPSDLYYNNEPLDLNSLLYVLKGQMTTRWYEFGVAIKIPMPFLNQLIDQPEENRLVELLDYWLRHHPDQPTWQEILDARDKI
jgi:hypothetical protein